MLDHGADINSSHGRVFKDHPKVQDRVHGDEMSVAILRDATTRYYSDMHGMHTPLICALYQLRRRFANLSRQYLFRLPESREREKMEASVKFAASAVETLLLAGADPNLVTPYVQGVPPLTIAVEELCARTHNEGVGEADSLETWKWSLVDTLLDRGADPNGRDHTGATALMLVVQRVLAVEKFAAVVDLLVERGADIHLYDHWGETALRKAVRHGNATAVRLLLSKGAKFDVRPPNVFYLEMDKRVRAFLNDHIDLDTLKIGDEDTDGRAVEAIVDCFYSGQLSLSQSTVSSVIRTANLLGVGVAEKVATAAIGSTISAVEGATARSPAATR